MERYLTDEIRRDLEEKIVFISGPRQCGKTTLSKMITPSFDYFNWDYSEHRIDVNEQTWDRSKKLIIFDELHKKTNWKSWIKGIYDVEGIPPRYLITGSARLEARRKTGDSLAGRYFRYHLHPFDLKEVRNHIDPGDGYRRICTVSGFPEPFLKDSERFYKRWKKTHTDIILRQDMIDLEDIRDIPAIETLIELLRRRVGSPVSYASLAQDLERDPKTVKTWLQYLENLYILFPVRPFHKNVARSLLKMPKYYLYDTAQVASGEGYKLENYAACALLKELHRIRDTLGLDVSLNYLRTKEGREIDFAVTIASEVTHLIEIKTHDDSLSRNFAHFRKYFPTAMRMQLVEKLSREKTYPDGSEIRDAVEWLARIDFSSL